MPNQILEQKMMMITNEKTLSLGFSALAERANNIKFPKMQQNREILVVVQNPNNIQYEIKEENARVIELQNRGVAKSRNSVLKNANSKYLIFGDDDIEFDESGLQKLIEYFETHPECSIIMAQTTDETGTLRKTYPNKQHRLTKLNSAKAATYEMMIRVAAIRDKGVRFDENFGAGVPNFLGDEYIFIADAIDQGLQGVFLPIRIAIHPKDSSGSTWGTKRDLSARAAVFSRVFGIAAPVFRALFLLKSRKGSVGFVNALRFIFGK